MLTRWPTDWVPGWVETMTSVARDETAHLSQVTRLIFRRGGRLERGHTNPYAKELRGLVRKGGVEEGIDRLMVSALIEARSCERFAVLAEASREADGELSRFYERLYASELGHFQTFLKLAAKLADAKEVEPRWGFLLRAERDILAAQPFAYRMHGGLPGS
jgi:tRNA-(ms[2]io[6]A)-hydroxylase